MNPFDIALFIIVAVLAVTALTVVYRMIVGPTILDRAISTDMLVVLVVLGMAVYTASAQAAWAGPVMLGLTGLAFIGTVTFARFVAREDLEEVPKSVPDGLPEIGDGESAAIRTSADAEGEPLDPVRSGEGSFGADLGEGRGR